MKRTQRLLALLVAILSVHSEAATVSLADPQDGGIGYKYTVTMSGNDSAAFSSHVGAWSWEDNSLFDASAGDPPVGWTHTSNWVALNVSARVLFTVRLERDANVPWPSETDPNRLASTASMFPSLTIFRNWDNDVVPAEFAARPDVIAAWAPFGGVPPDLGDWHTYNNRGAVEWAEDLVYVEHYDNSTLETIERTYVLPAGNYSIVIGSNAPATDPTRQGYRATFTTLPALQSDSYFTSNPAKPVVIAAAQGALANDEGIIVPGDMAEKTTEPGNGQASLSADGALTYTPGAYFGVAGRDSFHYRVLLGGNTSTPTGTNTITISTVQAAAGCYAGLIRDEATENIAGALKLDLTRSGSWTASIVHAGKRHALRGTLMLDGTLLPSRVRANSPTLRLSTHENGTRFAEIKIAGDLGTFVGQADQSPFSVLTPPPFTGNHAVTLTVTSSSDGAPQEPGRATLKIKSNGAAKLVGRLGDRTAFSSSSALVVGESNAGPVLPVFDAIYRAKAGSVSGHLQFGAAADSHATGGLKAVKPAQTQPASPGFTILYEAATTAR